MRVSTIGLGVAAVVAGGLMMWSAVSAAGAGDAEWRTVVVHDGERRRVVRTDARTIGELLERIDTALAIGDKIAPALDATIYDNFSHVNIWRATPFMVLEWADSRTARLHGQAGQPFRPQFYDVVRGEEYWRQRAEEVVGWGRPSQAHLTPLKIQWMTEAGIPEEDWVYVDFIVFRESSWNPNAVNRISGACGLAQAFPCSRVPGNPFDPVNSLRWQHQYVLGRYGSYAAAYAFWQIHGWY
ncbi:ubiquitin-like domain-containing protein [Candidatus Saccharibacteria bacterium]|nr:ubiquitin-like domain-containing protein [Candidatus Saccharibacteria bacterium]